MPLGSKRSISQGNVEATQYTSRLHMPQREERAKFRYNNQMIDLTFMVDMRLTSRRIYTRWKSYKMKMIDKKKKL